MVCGAPDYIIESADALGIKLSINFVNNAMAIRISSLLYLSVIIYITSVIFTPIQSELLPPQSIQTTHK